VKFLKEDKKLGALAFGIDLKTKDQFTEFLEAIFSKSPKTYVPKGSQRAR
jgi:hypothetical protein